MTDFAESIGLSQDWPKESAKDEEVNVEGALIWASAYFEAAEKLNFELWRERRSPQYMGPVIQTVGLATELVLKTLLRGCRKNERQLRKYNHNTYAAYFDARECFNELDFMNLHFMNTSHLAVPAEVIERLTKQGEKDVEVRWRCFFDHLRLLDGLYDRPYRSRYIKPGALELPDTELILIGLKIFLSAMEERLNCK